MRFSFHVIWEDSFTFLKVSSSDSQSLWFRICWKRKKTIHANVLPEKPLEYCLHYYSNQYFFDLAYQKWIFYNSLQKKTSVSKIPYSLEPKSIRDRHLDFFKLHLSIYGVLLYFSGLSNWKFFVIAPGPMNVLIKNKKNRFDITRNIKIETLVQYSCKNIPTETVLFLFLSAFSFEV